MIDDNPYAAPQSSFTPPVPLMDGLPLATQGQRFLNYLIDAVVSLVVEYAASYALVTVAIEAGTDLAYFESTDYRLAEFLLNISIGVAYYVVLEGLTGRTIGKFVTGTQVVAEGGGPPTFGQVLGRSLCRLIPFEPFSFLGKQAVGWHDTIPKTRVVQVR